MDAVLPEGLVSGVEIIPRSPPVISPATPGDITRGLGLVMDRATTPLSVGQAQITVE